MHHTHTEQPWQRLPAWPGLCPWVQRAWCHQHLPRSHPVWPVSICWCIVTLLCRSCPTAHGASLCWVGAALPASCGHLWPKQQRANVWCENPHKALLKFIYDLWKSLHLKKTNSFANPGVMAFTVHIFFIRAGLLIFLYHPQWEQCRRSMTSSPKWVNLSRYCLLTASPEAMIQLQESLVMKGVERDKDKLGESWEHARGRACIQDPETLPPVNLIIGKKEGSD